MGIGLGERRCEMAVLLMIREKDEKDGSVLGGIVFSRLGV
jgi:hypothetical protein